MTSATLHMEFSPNGIPYVVPNRVTSHSDDFYISYNNYDRSIYGSDTTALVVGQMQRFYILNGNHENQLKNKSFKECLNYFHNHNELTNKHSDKFPARDWSISKILSVPDEFEILIQKLKEKESKTP